AQPCPVCSAGGSPDSPGTGTCDRGPRRGLPCTSTNSAGLTRDCPTGGADPCPPGTPGTPPFTCAPGGGGCCDGAHVGPIKVDLSPLTTGTATASDAGGLFCPGQGAAQVGCFGDQACRTITETGSPAGPITPEVPADATLASVFCIAATGNGLVDASANLPGPGAVSLPGQFVVREIECATSTTTTSSTSSTTMTTTTSTTTTTMPICGDGVKHQASEDCDGDDFGGLFCPSSATGGILLCTEDCTIDFSQCPDAMTGTLDFALSAAGGTCGNTQDSSAVVLKNLTCGGLNIGGGQSIVPEGPTPDGSTSRFAIVCLGSTCTIGPTSSNPPVNTAGPDCTDTGCNFGTPLPIPNPTIPTITTCVLNTWQAPATGTLNLATGTSSTNVPLVSDVYLTGNLAQPCPVCSGSGSPGSPGTGTCDRGPRAGMACTSTNSDGLTRDCLTGGSSPASNCGPAGDQPCTCEPGGSFCLDGSHVGPINVNLSPLTTGTASDTDADGLFCPDQGPAQVGCFGSTACRTITENGVPAGTITPGTPATATLASVFCIAATGNGLVDASANLPGPGAVSLPGSFLVDLDG
ncbi:MAG: hypothetical protein L0Y54_02990, partial [Sporichthyaceae bacterium]|nr:hypothetical protein [Sporichthyaceae bacterium]